MSKETEEQILSILKSAGNGLISLLEGTDKTDLVIYGGLGYLSMAKLAPIDAPLDDKLLAFLYGPIALKLATAPVSSGGELGVDILGTGFNIPVNSQVVGLVMLAALGIAILPWNELTAGSSSAGDIMANSKDLIDQVDTWINTDVTAKFILPEELRELQRLEGLCRVRLHALVFLQSSPLVANLAALKAYWLQVQANCLTRYNASVPVGGQMSGGAR